MIRRSSEPRKKNTALNDDREFFSSPIYYLLSMHSPFVDTRYLNVEYLLFNLLISTSNAYTLANDDNDDDDNKTQAGQFAEIGKLQYLRSIYTQYIGIYLAGAVANKKNQSLRLLICGCRIADSDP